MAFPPFKDITKSLNDLLKKGFPTAEKYSFRVEFDNTSSSGTQVTPFLQRVGENLEGELKVKCGCSDYQVTTTENLKQEVSFEISNAKHTARGLKFTLNLSSNLSEFVEKAKGKITGELKNDVTTTSLTVEHPIKQSGAGVRSDDAKLIINSVFGLKEKGVSAGVESEISLSTHSPKTLNTTLLFTKKDLDLALFSKKKFGTNSLILGANFFQKLESSKWTDAQLGGEISYDIGEKSPSLALATQFKPADSATFKTRFDSKGLLGFLYTERWQGPLTVSFGADWNVLGGANPFQHSIKLLFK
jgi:hypothetical protein